MLIILPENVLYIISCLNKAGFSAHIVGGCVRDLFLKREPKDWDITTSATPDEVMTVFKKTHGTGLKHGTVLVVLNGEGYEVTTWRTESGYSDHRRPDAVTFARSLKEDLARRDFTINALAWHPEEGLIDPFGGIRDMEARLLKCVGNAEERFGEDALRMLRAIRFAAQLNFVLDGATRDAIIKQASDLAYVSFERMQAELTRLLGSQAPWKLSLLWETGLHPHLFPSLPQPPEHYEAVFRHLSRDNAPFPLYLMTLFACVFGSTAAKELTEALKRLKYDLKTIKRCQKGLEALELIACPTPRNKRFCHWLLGKEALKDSLWLRHALKASRDSEEATPYSGDKAETDFHLSFTPQGLMEKNLAHGKRLGELLDALTLCAFEKPELNREDVLEELARAVLSARFTGG